MLTTVDSSVLYKSLIDQASGLDDIPSSSAKQFAEKSETLVQILENKSLKRFQNSETEKFVIQEKLWFDRMNFINAFALSCPQTLVKLMVWSYQVYKEKGLDFGNFFEDHKNWARAVNKIMPGNKAMVEVFDWLASCHESFIELAEDNNTSFFPNDVELNAESGAFLSFLLDADYKNAVENARGYFNKNQSAISVYQDLIQPAMYKIGIMWQKNEISPAEEHLATSIVSRIITNIYEIFPFEASNKNRCAVCTIEGEKHFIGSRMFADMLELEGWDVEYIGADIPNNVICQYLNKQKNIKLLAVSVSMTFNLDRLRQLVKMVKSQCDNVSILTGGLAIEIMPFVKKIINADTFASNTIEGLKAARKIKV